MFSKYSDYRGRSFAHILEINRGAGRGFDWLRLLLATAILLSHSSSLVGTSGVANQVLNWILQLPPETTARIANATKSAEFGEARQLTGLARPLTLAYLPMFFALSGFLVAGSAMRTRKVLPFLCLRGLRLLPALVVEVILSALLLGTIFTTLPLSEYFSCPVFWNYFWNIFGHPQFYLPGVFSQNIITMVNANLWTLPWELYCYVAISFFIISGLIYRREIFSVIYVLLTFLLVYCSFSYGFEVRPAHLGGPTLIFYFLTGMFFYMWRDKIVLHEVLFLVSCIACYALMMSPKTVYLYPVLLTYITIFIGLFPFPKSKIILSGDYSYGIYLYGFPVTQSIIAIAPWLKGNIFLVAPTALVLTVGFAVLSWHGVEKHFLKLKRLFAPKSAAITTRLHPYVVEDDPSKQVSGVGRSQAG